MFAYKPSAWAALAGCWLAAAAAGATPLPQQADAAPAAPPTSPAGGSYERWEPASLLAEPERRLVHDVRQWRYRRGGHLAYDGRLARAAEGLLAWAQSHAGEPFPLGALRAAAWAQGWTDGELAAVAVDASAGELRCALRRQLQRTLGDDRELDQLGLALAVDANASAGAPEPPRQTVVVALSRRLVHLAPVARTVPGGGKLTLSGRLVAPHVQGATLVAQRPDGALLRVPATLDGGLVVATLPAGRRAGALHVQLLVERGQGPEVAASFPVQVAEAAGAAEDERGPVGAPAHLAHEAQAGLEVADAGGDGPSDEAATAGHHGSLLSLLYGLRAAHNLPLPAPTPALMRVARVHAEDMAKHHFFAHVSPRTGSVTDRLLRARQPYLHVVENLAEGTDPDQAFAQWLQSPGHRLNLLDPRVDAVGVAAVPGGRSAPTVAVLVMAALPQGEHAAP